MISHVEAKSRGTIYTFYSFKGGVGRTMALANASVLLAEWGHSVLVVDWDLEAPGLERFYDSLSPDIQTQRKTTPGIIDLVNAKVSGTPLQWQDCLLNIKGPGSSGRLAMLSAGLSDEQYSNRLQAIHFPELFESHGLGNYIEELRNEWIASFDFILIDSRTGVTDIGGICTVHFADVLVLLFTTTESSTNGAKDIIERARKAQSRLPVDRTRLLALPLPSRDESRTEYSRAMEWKKKFADQFGDYFRDWLPPGVSALDAIEQIRIPYIPYWSFEERLPVIEEGTSDRAGLGHAYEMLARLLAARLDWIEAFKGESLAPPPVTPPRRELDKDWLHRHRTGAVDVFSNRGETGFMEIVHYCPDSQVARSQKDLLAAARLAQIRTFYPPIGVVDESPSMPRPLAVSDGIVSMPLHDVDRHLFQPVTYYWALSKAGEFYSCNTLSVAQDSQQSTNSPIYFDVSIAKATEAVMHCVRLYKAMGIDLNANVEMLVRYAGLKGRALAAASPLRMLPNLAKNWGESEVRIESFTFQLGSAETGIIELVKKICEPLFVVFDFSSFDDNVYRQIVADFMEGKIR